MKFEFDTDELEKKVGDIEGSRSRGVWLVKLAQLFKLAQTWKKF